MNTRATRIIAAAAPSVTHVIRSKETRPYSDPSRVWVPRHAWFALRGEVETGISRAEAALVTLMSVPSRQFHLPIRIALVARARMAGGDIDGALSLFDTALEAASSTGERWYEPEMLRLKARTLIAQSEHNVVAAERCLTAAIALAQKQEARFWELRAGTALAELWKQQGTTCRRPVT